MKIKGVSFLALMLWGMWLILNNSLEAQIVISGLFVSLLLSVALNRYALDFKTLRLTPRAFIALIGFVSVFIIELVKSNMDVAWRVLSPSLPINPGIVEVRTKLTSPLGRLILSSSITLTPGTLTVEMTGDRLFIHWIDVKAGDMEGATQAIVAKFERYLEVIYG